MKPILAVVHIYYPKLWPELKECLNNITEPYNLYVTTVADNKYLEKDVLKFKSDAHFEVVENRGYDIGPFVHVINKLELSDYSYVVKLHTKRDMPEGSLVKSYNCSGAKWRSWALSFLKNGNFKKCLHSLENNGKLGMIGNFHLIMKNENNGDPKAKERAVSLLDKAQLSFNKYGFAAGTMFIARAELLKPVQYLKLELTDFAVPDKNHTSGLAHAIERFLGICIYSQHYEILDTYTPKILQLAAYFWTVIRHVRHFIYKAKVNKQGIYSVKIFKIKVYKKFVGQKSSA